MKIKVLAQLQGLVKFISSLLQFFPQLLIDLCSLDFLFRQPYQDLIIETIELDGIIFKLKPKYTFNLCCICNLQKMAFYSIHIPISENPLRSQAQTIYDNSMRQLKNIVNRIKGFLDNDDTFLFAQDEQLLQKILQMDLQCFKVNELELICFHFHVDWSAFVGDKLWCFFYHLLNVHILINWHCSDTFRFIHPLLIFLKRFLTSNIMTFLIFKLIMVRKPVPRGHLTCGQSCILQFAFFGDPLCINLHFVTSFCTFQCSHYSDNSTTQNSDFLFLDALLNSQDSGFLSSGWSQRDTCSSMPIIVNNYFASDDFLLQSDSTFAEWSDPCKDSSLQMRRDLREIGDGYCLQ